MLADACLRVSRRAVWQLNALAMEPVGHIAGMGSAIVGSLSTLVALPFAYVIGQLFNDTVLPLVGGFSLLGLAALITAASTALATDRQ